MLVNRFKRLLGTTNTREKFSQNDFYNSLYPEDVRYALAHKEAQLGKSEIRSLIDRFTYIAVYLMTKAVAYSPEKQRQYLEALTRIYSKSDYHLDDLRGFLLKQMDVVPDDVSLGGAKLLQVSRAGSDHWQQAFRDLAERIYAESPRALPCIVAYTPMMGYQHFVKVFSQDSLGKMQLLVPDWMLDPKNDHMGYEITLGRDASVHSQVKNECLYGAWMCLHFECPMKHRFCEDAVFVDDTISTGATSSKVRSFWHSEYGMNVPEERIWVITDLRNSTVSKIPIDDAPRKDTNNASDERN